MLYILIILLFGLIFSGCTAHNYKMFGNSGKYTKTVSDANHTKGIKFEWKIATGDRVQILVQNQSVAADGRQLNVLLDTANEGNYQVRDGTEGILIPQSGNIRLPLLNVVNIKGLTEEQAAAKLDKLYHKYLKHPFVSVKILNQKLFVLGEVRSPGVVQVTNGTMSLFEALAKSGDLTDSADRTNVKIIRGGTRKPMVKEIDLSDLSKMTMTRLTLRPNDIIYVQPRTMKAYNTAFNEIPPFFNMISSVLAPFLTIHTINEIGATDVFLLRK